MGFKVDTSFLRFLTMGALGVRRVADELRERGFEPIELERYGTSNKIWATKVKRLRLPDLLCVRTGLRAEVRAKSDLKIRMSDAPLNPDRVWDAGLRDDDVIALVACSDGPDGTPVPANHAMYFSVGDLRSSVGTSTLGPPKSASEGAERDRTWPAIVPSRSGIVDSLAEGRLVVTMDGDGIPPRRQTYALRGKHSYVAPGNRFQSGVTFLAGTPASLADLGRYRRDAYNPLDQLSSPSPLDRYAAVKAIRFRPDLHNQARGPLDAMLDNEPESRVALETAASAATLGIAKGEDRLRTTLLGAGPSALSMEAILILTELKSPFARLELEQAAGHFHGDERRQAAIWGLGKAGLKAYGDLIPFISDDEENVAYHAIAAFGTDVPVPVIERLIGLLIPGEPRTAAAASEALRVIGSAEALDCIIQAANDRQGHDADWILATLGRMPPDLVRRRLSGTPLLGRVEPMLLIAHGANWLATEDAVTDMAFLLKQSL